MELKFKPYSLTQQDVNYIKSRVHYLAEAKHHERGSFNTDGDCDDEQYTDSNGLKWGISVTGIYNINGSITIWSLTLVLSNTDGEIWVHIPDTEQFEREADTDTGHFDDWTTHSAKDFLI